MSDLLQECRYCAPSRGALAHFRNVCGAGLHKEPETLIHLTYRGAAISLAGLAVQCEYCNDAGYTLTDKGQALRTAMKAADAQDDEIKAAEKIESELTY